MQRERRIQSGKLLEVDFFPVFNDGRKIPERAPGIKRSSAEQEKYNRSQSAKRMVRYANTNFDNTDYFAHFTYFAENAPESVKRARSQFNNFLGRIKRRRAREAKILRRRIEKLISALASDPANDELANLIESLEANVRKLESEFKYMYVVEETIYKTGKYAGLISYHFHAFITGGLDARVIESMWTLGERSKCNYFDPERFGPESAAKYMSKELSREKRFSHSTNLKKPRELKPRDGKITPRGVEKLAKERIDDREYWERRYPGYRFLRCYARHNSYNGYYYVSAVMYQSTSVMPEWTLDDDLWMPD